MNCNPPASSVHEISKARVLDGLSFHSPGDFSQPRDQTHISGIGSSLVAQMVKCLPTMWEPWVLSLGQEDPLEKEMANHSSTLSWKIPWTEEAGRLQSMGLQRVGHD